MKLRRLTDRIWYYPYEQDRDRPILGYIRGDRWSLAVDAGHSAGHTAEFYGALETAGLPLPHLTVLTHWHWDHTFGMHAIHGLSVANRATADHLRHIRNQITQNGPEDFLALDPSIRLEYAGNRPVVVALPDMVFEDVLALDPGGCPVRLFRAPSPHTDDSALVHIPGERTLFLGDSAAGIFPTWEKDPALAFRLADAVAPLDVEICLESHIDPETRQELLDDLRSCV